MEVYYVGNTSYSSELYHHGILGQKWGQRNGPPYPLGSGDHSSREVKAGWKKSLANNGQLKEKRKKVKQLKKEETKAYNKMYNNTYLAYSPKKEHREQYEALSKEWDKVRKEYKDAKIDYKKSKQIAKGILDENGNRIAKNPDRPKSNLSIKVQETLGLNDEEYAKVKKYAKIAGISLATTAGVVAAAYFICQYKKNNALLPTLERGYNKDQLHYSHPFKMDNGLFKNAFNGDYVGSKAKANGYGLINSAFIRSAINNPQTGIDPDKLIRDVRLNQVDMGALRRLSCWSTSESYFMSMLTGHQFASKSFQNLVDFNDFGKLYNGKINIFNADGKLAKDFVGAFGKEHFRADSLTGENLVSSIFKNISSKNNLTPDGTRTVGFINAGYHGTTCTHQWNFELGHCLDGVKRLIISDGYSGERYTVADLIPGKGIKYDNLGFSKMMEELHHYNADSIRFYAPSLGDLNLDMLSNVILGKL